MPPQEAQRTRDNWILLLMGAPICIQEYTSVVRLLDFLPRSGFPPKLKKHHVPVLRRTLLLPCNCCKTSLAHPARDLPPVYFSALRSDHDLRISLLAIDKRFMILMITPLKMTAFLNHVLHSHLCTWTCLSFAESDPALFCSV